MLPKQKREFGYDISDGGQDHPRQETVLLMSLANDSYVSIKTCPVRESYVCKNPQFKNVGIFNGNGSFLYPVGWREALHGEHNSDAISLGHCTIARPVA